MFIIYESNSSKPYKELKKYYLKAKKANQKSIDSIVISSFDKVNNEVESRYVNLKYIIDDNWIFFTNYNSNKAYNFSSHKQISALLYWNSINVQIRMKANIIKSDSNISDDHFENRSYKKNILAISSHQSKKINSYDDVVKNYKKTYESTSDKLERPDYWGGYSFTPYYFEFWTGEKNRINKREVYEYKNKIWHHHFLQP